MWAVAPETALVGGWVDRVLEARPAKQRGPAKALIARGYSDYEKSPELANEATRIAESSGDPGVRSYSYDIRG